MSALANLALKSRKTKTVHVPKIPVCWKRQVNISSIVLSDLMKVCSGIAWNDTQPSL